MINNKGYYSEPMEMLQGRLHVTSCSITLELILNDLDGKRRIVSMPLDNDSGSKLTEDWEDCRKRSNNGETHSVETLNRVLFPGDKPTITIYKSFGKINNEEKIEKIAQEIEEAVVRGYQVQAALFTSSSNVGEADMTLPTQKGRDKRAKKSTDRPKLEKSIPIKNAEENAKHALGNLVDALSEWTEAKGEECMPESAPANEEKPLAPMPDMNNYRELGDAPFLQMIRDLSFNPSDTDVLRAKAVLLISVMDFIAAGKIATPNIIPTHLLKKKYETAWIRNVGRECTKDFKTAFLMLNDERFWRLETTMNNNQGESEIRGIKFAKMDDQLFKAMTNGGNRGKLRLILTARCK